MMWFRRNLRLKALPAALWMALFGAGCAARGVPATRSGDQWAVVQRLSLGERVALETLTGDVTRGEVEGVDATGIRIRASSGSLRFARAEVRRIARVLRGDDSLKNGAIIGAAIGAGYVLVVLAMLAADGDAEITPAGSVAGGALFTGIGAAIGALVDSLRHGEREEVIYVAGR